MPRLTRRYAIAILSGAALMPMAAAAQGQSLTGRYRAEGRNPDGSIYSGSVELNDAFGKITMIWKVGSQSYEGLGTRDGRVLTVDWGDTHPVVYVVMPDGSLHGTWANGTALERLSR